MLTLQMKENVLEVSNVLVLLLVYNLFCLVKIVFIQAYSDLLINLFV